MRIAAALIIVLAIGLAALLLWLEVPGLYAVTGGVAAAMIAGSVAAVLRASPEQRKEWSEDDLP
jgi:hypothetical protein